MDQPVAGASVAPPIVVGSTPDEVIV